MKNIYLLVLLILFILLSFFVKDSNFTIDLFINSWAQGIVTVFWIKFFNFIAWLWDTYWIIIIALFVIIFLFIKNLYLKIWILVWTMFATVWSSTLVKFLVERDRPENRIFEYHWYSFPSWHSTMSILFYWLVLYFILEEINSKVVRKILIVFSLFLSTLVIFSRIYLSVHWLTDIIWWILLWNFWLIIWVLVYKKFKK